MTNVHQIKVLDKIRGSSFLAIQEAMNVLQRHNPDLTHYKIDVVGDGKAVVVIFSDKSGQSRSRGKIGVRSGSDVELDAAELQAFVSKMDEKDVLDTIEGSSFLATRAASEVFQRHNPDLAEYKIEVVRDGKSVVVVFSDKNRKARTRGSLGVRPGFEVEMDAKDLRVLRSNFVR